MAKYLVSAAAAVVVAAAVAEQPMAYVLTATEGIEMWQDGHPNNLRTVWRRPCENRLVKCVVLDRDAVGFQLRSE